MWLNALDRVLESARKCRSLDELLHGGILEQGRKAKGLAGELFYLPVALVAFTRFGYLMRRVFFRLMLGDLNIIMDGLTELEDKGVQTIDCRRAQFSAQEPILRLRMICQSWKVMFQAEYSSGSPLRMLGRFESLGRACPRSGQERTRRKRRSWRQRAKLVAPAKPVMAKPADAGKNSLRTGETSCWQRKQRQLRRQDRQYPRTATTPAKSAARAIRQLPNLRCPARPVGTRNRIRQKSNQSCPLHTRRNVHQIACSRKGSCSWKRRPF